MSSEKIPRVTTLRIIEPAFESTRKEVLEYPLIQEAAASHRPLEYARLRKTFESDNDSLEELESARQQAFQYMLFTVDALRTAITAKDRVVWSNRYTKATSDLYGVPNPDVAKRILEDFCNSEYSRPFTEIAQQAGSYFNEHYGDVYAALELDNAPESISMEDAAERIKHGIQVLADNEELWGRWSVSRNYDKSQMSVAATSRKVIIGMSGRPVTPSDLKRLFTHEVLVHAARAVGDEKAGAYNQYPGGLPGYLDIDEGLGIFSEYAVTGDVPMRIYDRYVDIAYALGQIDGKPHTRQELLYVALQRAIDRNEKAESPKSIEDITSNVYNHVNRIYRGSRGDEYIGIYTKDITYYAGFLKIGEYIENEISRGKAMPEVLDYVLSGRFDPTNEKHVRHIAKRPVK